MAYIAVYALIYSFGVIYFYRLFRDGFTTSTPAATGYGFHMETAE